MNRVRRSRPAAPPAGGFLLKPVGVVRSPFKNPEDLPPPAFAPPRFLDHVAGEIAVFDEFAPALESLEGFSHIIVIFAFHRASGFKLRTVPPGESRPRGVFATRSPHRPNPLGMSVVRLLSRDGPVLKVSGLDLVDGTPVLDIKPYTRRDRKSRIRTGWLKDRPAVAR
ncbi:MAG: tRNA (N6-threonylcarbamoyladenosine(37)-N6)-methyltransferase TrmO [Candidatus Aminicenantales bacterium]|jgi:tRNA-Thr(GGU) m(6)t(6)A37 methyltransferase TsaA